MKIATWNIRGFNMPLKQNGVRHLIHQHNIDVLGILENKLVVHKLRNIMNKKFKGWKEINNFQEVSGGRIMIIWNPITALVEPLEITSQAIHCLVKCNVSSLVFQVSVVYALYGIICETGVPISHNLGFYWEISIVLGVQKKIERIRSDYL